MALTDLIGKLMGSRTKPSLNDEMHSKQIDEAYKDLQTGVYNANYLSKQLLSNSLDKQFKWQKTKILTFSLDNFNEISKIYGNVKTEKLLKATAQLLNSYQNKKFISRCDRDKFLLIAESPNGEIGEFLDQAKRKLKAYNMRLQDVSLALTITNMAMMKGETLKDAVTRSEQLINQEQTSKPAKKETELPKIVAVLDRREETALYLKYLLGQMTIENKSDLKVLFEPINYDTRERIENQRKIIKRSGLDVRIFVSYEEFTEFCQTVVADNAILYKLKEGQRTIVDLLEDLHPNYQTEKPKTRYFVPEAKNLVGEERALIDIIKKMRLADVLFPESMDFETLLLSIRHLPSKKQ